MEQNSTNFNSTEGLSELDHDWWEDLSIEQIKGIERGLKDIEEGRVISHDEVRLKFGL